MNKFDKCIENTRITVHGGMDYKEEKPEAFNMGGSGHGHPILTIEMGKTVKHFKCTSINPSMTNKGSYIRDQFYTFKDPSTCELDKTYKAVKQPHIQPVVDLNHSVYIVNNETPPLPILRNGVNDNQTSDQTSYEVSQQDKIGILSHIINHVSTHGKIRQPSVSKSACIEADQKWLNAHPRHKQHPIQVVKDYPLELNLDDLELSDKVANKLFN